MLVDRIRETGSSVHLTSEPTARPIGKLARRILAGDVIVPPEAIAHVFAADRTDHVHGRSGIVEHLDNGAIVVCDRYKYSSLAYQGLDAGADLVRMLNAPFPDPQLLIFVDLPPDVGEERLSRRNRRDIYETMSFQERVRARYLEVLSDVPDSVIVVTVDGTRPADELAQKIWEAVQSASILEV